MTAWQGLRGAAVALEAIERRAAAGLDAQELLEEVSGRIRRVVPADAAFLAATDSETLLPMGAGVLQAMPAEMCVPLWDHEFFVPDFNKFAELGAGPRTVGDLHEATGGQVTRSPRWRALNALTGWNAEVRAAFAVDGATWGLAQLNRMPESGRFTAAEVAWLQDVAPVVARGLRAALLGHPGEGASRGPGVVVLDADGEIASLTPEATAWLAEVDDAAPAGEPGSAIPFRIYAQAAAMRARAARPGSDPVTSRRIRLRTRSGVWLLLHVSSLPESDDGPARAVMVVEPARASDVAPLIIEAYNFTPREIEVARLIARGAKTSEIADTLYLSIHTVRDHIKAIFEKAGVTSRGELTAKLFAEHYLPGVHAAMEGAAERLPYATADPAWASTPRSGG